MSLLSEDLMVKPFINWSLEEVKYMLAMIDFESENILNKNSYYKYYMAEKRKIIQPIVNKIYDEVFASFGKKVTVVIERSEYDYIRNWAETKYIPYKNKTDYGYKGGDVSKEVERLITGTCGNLAVVKYYGGGMSDLDFTIGKSKGYNVPDLKKFLGGIDLGVKTARTGEFANLPLVLDYASFTHEYKNDKRNKNKMVEAQLFAGQNESNDLKYYIIGVAKPRDIIEGAHKAFTLDPKAMSPKKAGGRKGGFFAMHNTVHCNSKADLKKLLTDPEFQAIPYTKI